MIATSVNIQLHIHKWNHTITTSAQYSLQKLSFFTYIFIFELLCKTKSLPFSSQLVYTLCWNCTFFWVGCIHMSSSPCYWNSSTCTWTKNIYVDRLWNLVHFMHCIFWASALKVYLLLSYLSCSTLFIPSNPLPFTFPGVSLYPGPHPCPRLVENKSDNSY